MKASDVAAALLYDKDGATVGGSQVVQVDEDGSFTHHFQGLDTGEYTAKLFINGRALLGVEARLTVKAMDAGDVGEALDAAFNPTQEPRTGQVTWNDLPGVSSYNVTINNGAGSTMEATAASGYAGEGLGAFNALDAGCSGGICFATFDRLVPATTYRAEVAYTTSSGTESEDIPAPEEVEVPPLPTPEAGVNLPTDTSMLVKWNPIDEAVEYTVVINNKMGDKRTFITKETSVTVENLVPGTAYEIDITYRTADGFDSPRAEVDEVVPPAPTEVTRVAGKDRYGTNLELLKKTHEAGQPVFVATGATYPDALSIGAAAGAEGGSLVLTPTGTIRSDTLAFLTQNKPSKIWIAGGTGAVSKNVENQLKKIAPVQRLGGADRYETSAAIFDQFFKAGSSDAFVATGRDFPDALSASAAGGSVNAGVLLVNGSSAKQLLPRMVASMKAAGVAKVHIVGGKGAVNASIENSLRSQGFTVTRLGGVDRYATNAAVNEFLGLTGATGVWIATGANFPDALSAAVPASGEGQRLALSRTACIPGDISWIDGDGSKVSTATLVGGTGVLTAKVESLTPCEPSNRFP